MGVFRKFTRASLRRNRVRTIVTIIGIVLSMALFTAVIEGAYSGLQFLVRSETESVGAFHGYYYNMSDEEANQIRTSDQVKDSASWDRVGWAKVDSLNRNLILEGGKIIPLGEIIDIESTGPGKAPEPENA